MPLYFLGSSLPAFVPLAGAAVDMDFTTGGYYGVTAADLTVGGGSLKITSAGLQVVTGDVIKCTHAAMLAALNAATTVIRVRTTGPDTATANGSGIFLAKTGANSTLSHRLRGSPNQTGLAAAHSPAGATVSSFAVGAAGAFTTGAPFVSASRHRTTNCAVSANGGAVTSSAPAGKSSTVDLVQFGISEGGVVLNSYIERLTIWTDDPSDAVLQSRAT